MTQAHKLFKAPENVINTIPCMIYMNLNIISKIMGNAMHIGFDRATFYIWSFECFMKGWINRVERSQTIHYNKYSKAQYAIKLSTITKYKKMQKNSLIFAQIFK